AAMLPLVGALSDRVGRRPPEVAGVVGFLLLTYPLFRLLARGEFGTTVAALCVFAALLATFQGSFPAQFVELFPARTRYSGLSLGYNLAMALFGGTAPLVATSLAHLTSDNAAPGFYIMAIAALTLGVLIIIPETYRNPLQ